VKKIQLICDCCGKEVPLPTGGEVALWTIRVSLSSSDYESPFRQKKAEWCRECIERVGMLPPIELEEKELPIPTPPSFEDLVRIIIREENAR